MRVEALRRHRARLHRQVERVDLLVRGGVQLAACIRAVMRNRPRPEAGERQHGNQRNIETLAQRSLRAKYRNVSLVTAGGCLVQWGVLRRNPSKY